MVQVKELNVAPRTERGKNESRRLKQAGFIPGVIYSHGNAESIKIPRKAFTTLFPHDISESVIFDVVFQEKGERQQAFVKNFQKDSMTGDILHVDLFKVTKGEKIHTQVHVELTGTAKGIKMGGILETGERIIEIKCLPSILPEKIIVDVTDLDIGHSVHVKDLKLDSGIEILTNQDAVIVSVHAARTAATEEVVPAAEGETGTGGETVQQD